MKNHNSLIIGIMFSLAGVLSHMTTTDAFKKSTDFESGARANAKVVAVDEISSLWRNRQEVTFEYEDQQGITRRSLLEANGFFWYELDNTSLISYQPGSYEYVRRQKARMPLELHKRWLLIFKVLTLAGLVVIAMPYIRRESGQHSHG